MSQPACFIDIVRLDILIGPDGKHVIPNLKETSKGTFQVEYIPVHVGEYICNQTLSSVHCTVFAFEFHMLCIDNLQRPFQPMLYLGMTCTISSVGFWH